MRTSRDVKYEGEEAHCRRHGYLGQPQHIDGEFLVYMCTGCSREDQAHPVHIEDVPLSALEAWEEHLEETILQASNPETFKERKQEVVRMIEERKNLEG